MHDIVAHAVSVMIVQAEAGAAAALPATAVQFDAISEAGREANEQLRRTLRVLRDGDPVERPSNGLAEVAPLVERIASTGLSVTLRTTGGAVDVAPDLGVAVHRIVQEALTNVVRHSGASTTEVHLDWRPGDLAVTVTDNGRGVRRTGDGAGQGLIGIRERAAACGGTATTGPSGQSGFQVRVELPLPRSGIMDP
ncbi:MAG: sensor histidine kinase [Stackebrandtia sp.]